LGFLKEPEAERVQEHLRLDPDPPAQHRNLGKPVPRYEKQVSAHRKKTPSCFLAAPGGSDPRTRRCHCGSRAGGGPDSCCCGSSIIGGAHRHTEVKSGSSRRCAEQCLQSEAVSSPLKILQGAGETNGICSQGISRAKRTKNTVKIWISYPDLHGICSPPMFEAPQRLRTPSTTRPAARSACSARRHHRRSTGTNLSLAPPTRPRTSTVVQRASTGWRSLLNDTTGRPKRVCRKTPPPSSINAPSWARCGNPRLCGLRFVQGLLRVATTGSVLRGRVVS